MGCGVRRTRRALGFESQNWIARILGIGHNRAHPLRAGSGRLIESRDERRLSGRCFPGVPVMQTAHSRQRFQHCALGRFRFDLPW
jgi:hypothetical protein